MATVKGPTPPGAPPGGQTDSTLSKVGEAIRNPDAPVKGAPKSPHLRAHQVHIYRHLRAAEIRKHRVEIEEEARKHSVGLAEGIEGPQREEEIDEESRIKGLNFDEKRKKKGRRQQSDDDRDQEDGEEAVALGQAAAAKGLANAEGAGKYFQDLPADRMGDPALTDPNEIRRFLGPSARFAQHAMLLAEARLKQGMPRDEVLGYLASIYVGVTDRAYALKALKAFGCGTGIIDLYPLELMKHLLEHVPSFFNRVSEGWFFSSTAPGGYKGEAGAPIVLTYDPELRIRGFALKGGGRPGYLLEPVDPPGTYHLTIQSPGKYSALISAISKDGQLLIEELEIDVREPAGA